MEQPPAFPKLPQPPIEALHPPAAASATSSPRRHRPTAPARLGLPPPRLTAQRHRRGNRATIAAGCSHAASVAHLRRCQDCPRGRLPLRTSFWLASAVAIILHVGIERHRSHLRPFSVLEQSQDNAPLSVSI